MIPPVRVGEPLLNECGHFLECIETGARPVSDAAFGVGVVNALAAIERSMANGGREEPITG